MRKIIFLLIFFILLNTTLVLAENSTNSSYQQKDMEIEILLTPPLTINYSYSSLFKITNKDHISGITDKINITVHYNLTRNISLVSEDFFQIIVNSHKSSGTGEIIFLLTALGAAKL